MSAQLHQSLQTFAQQISAEGTIQLETLRQDRQSMGDNLREGLAQFGIQLNQEMTQHLADLATQRQANASQQQTDLQDFHQSLQAQMAEQLADLAAHRQAEAETTRSNLVAFTEQLRMTVWGAEGIPVRIVSAPQSSTPKSTSSSSGASSSAPSNGYPQPQEQSSTSAPEALVEQAVAAISPANVEATADPASIWQMPTESPELAEETLADSSLTQDLPVAGTEPDQWALELTEDDILAYVNAYISDLQQQDPNLTLLQVIGNRDLVRELLTQGASDLGMDPADILAILRQMVAASAVTA